MQQAHSNIVRQVDAAVASNSYVVPKLCWTTFSALIRKFKILTHNDSSFGNWCALLFLR
jgi:hypothetical protein